MVQKKWKMTKTQIKGSCLNLIEFSSLSDEWEIRTSSPFFIFSKLFYRFLYHGDQKIFWWRICRWLAINFEIHLCSSGMNSIWPRRTFFLRSVQVGDRINWPLTPRDVYFLKMHANILKWSLACVDLESSFGAIQEGVCVSTICHRKPAGLHDHAHVPLVSFLKRK